MKLLTFDIEEFYHLLSVNVSEDVKDSYSVLDRVCTDILALLQMSSNKAMFFVVGEIAHKNKSLIRKIDEAGHVVGTHSMSHQLHSQMSDKEFVEDLLQSKSVLEDILGKPVSTYRAPGFSLTADFLRRYEVLRDCGIKLDFSIFLDGGSHGGIKRQIIEKYRMDKYSYEIAGVRSFPFVKSRVLGAHVPLLGGGYFRLFPAQVILRAARQSEYCMTYFHPRDFDPNQPVVKNLSLTRRFKSYVGLSGATNKLRSLVLENQWTDPRSLLDLELGLVEPSEGKL